MAFFTLNPESIRLETFTLLLVSFLFILVSALSSVANVPQNIGLLGVILACAYGIPALKGENASARNFAICASVLATLSAILLCIITIMNIIHVASGNYKSPDPEIDSRSVAFQIGMAIGFGLSVLIVVLACLLAVKHIKNSEAIRKDRNWIPTVVHMKANAYPGPYPGDPNMEHQQAAQRMIYQPTSQQGLTYPQQPASYPQQQA